LIWQEFRAQVQIVNERLAAEMAAAGGDVRSLIDQLQNQLPSTTPGPLEPGKIASWERLFGATERGLFSEPLGTFEKLRPMGRTLSAM